MGDKNNPVDMVGHDDKCIQTHMGEMFGDLLPMVVGDLPDSTQLLNRAKIMAFVVGAKGDKICAIVAVVPVF